MLLSIITPSILRPSLAETCRSVDLQELSDYEHLVMIDRPNDNLTLPGQLAHPNRRFNLCGRSHGNWGNRCRHEAYNLVNGEYILYIDDDDLYLPGAFDTIANTIDDHRPEWLIFPALVRGSRWLNVPPGKGKTVNSQFAYARSMNIRWPDTQEYSADGDLIEQLLAVSQPYVLDCPEPLVRVNESRYGGP